jgi:DNA-binding FadR family transcriptional regulator
MKKPSLNLHLSPFLEYLAGKIEIDRDRLPSLTEISRELGISIASLREQLEVARMMGLVEVKPKTGLRKLPYSFTPGILNSLNYALAVDNNRFYEYSDLRNHLESAYWNQAVVLLTDEDHLHLRELILKAKQKLMGNPIQIPHPEHRELHLCIYSRLNNLFVTGILESYWEMYEAEGLSLYTDLQYLNRVWNFHGQMVESICAGNFETGYRAMIDHMDLISHRPASTKLGEFE